MKDHPIPSVTDLLQYRAIGLVRATYKTPDLETFTRGVLIDSNGEEIEAVVLGRVMTLMRRHLSLDLPHLWVVYPRCRNEDKLHLQISGIWEPSTLGKEDLALKEVKNNGSNLDHLSEGDDYFSIRGELIYTKPETNDLVIKIRQKPKDNRKKTLPFKLLLKGNISKDQLRHFVSIDARRIGQQLHVEDFQVVSAMPDRKGKKKKPGIESER
tara:strand:- start:1862 stop:2497 length:636 start_codon:yes stop_codon:yes gene_type:complete